MGAQLHVGPEEARAGLFYDQFLPTLFAGLMPFLVIAGIAPSIHIDWSGIRNAAHRTKGPTPMPASR